MSALAVEADDARRVLLRLPRGMLPVAALFASLPTLSVLVVLNLRASPPALASLLEAFTLLYLVQVPLALYAAVFVSRLSEALAEACGKGGGARGGRLAVLAALVPLGFIAPLVGLGRVLSACGLGAAQRLGSGELDVALNVMTLGLHSVLYALLLERVVDQTLEQGRIGAAEKA